MNMKKTNKLLILKPIVCDVCGAENSINYDKHTISIDDKHRSYRDLSFNFCEECGNITNVDFS